MVHHVIDTVILICMPIRRSPLNYDLYQGEKHTFQEKLLLTSPTQISNVIYQITKNFFLLTQNNYYRYFKLFTFLYKFTVICATHIIM